MFTPGSTSCHEVTLTDPIPDVICWPDGTTKPSPVMVTLSIEAVNWNPETPIIWPGISACWPRVKVPCNPVGCSLVDWTKLKLPKVILIWLPVTSTGVLRPATVVPTEPVNWPALETITVASPEILEEPWAKSNWSSDAITNISWSIWIENDGDAKVLVNWPALETETVTSVDAPVAGKFIVDVNCCPVAITEKAPPQAKLPQVLLPQPIPVSVDSSTVAAPIVEVNCCPVTSCWIPKPTVDFR